jgi:tRNA (cytidine/uridine-2'-O-)-methyltransferase
MVQLALYQPDIALNVGASIRLCACLNADLHIIEPCGFPWDEKKIKRSALDYIEHLNLYRHSSWEKFIDQNQGSSRIILLTTKAKIAYTEFAFKQNDIILMGRESAGVPEEVHEVIGHKVIIPMKKECRSLNVVNSAAMVLGEALRQTGF